LVYSGKQAENSINNILASMDKKCLWEFVC